MYRELDGQALRGDAVLEVPLANLDPTDPKVVNDPKALKELAVRRSRFEQIATDADVEPRLHYGRMMGASEDLLEQQSFLRLLCAIGFANRYYGYCLRHPRQLGQTAAMPVSLVTEALEGTRRNFRYDWRENFFAFRAPSPSDDGELGVNVIIDRTRVEWVLVFKTASGHLGSTFAGLAHDATQLDNPGFQHDPPYPNPRASNKGELTKVLEEGLVLYDDIALAIMKQTWR